jgi:hypothetical protein
MKPRWFYLIAFLGLLVLGWYLITFLFGWSPESGLLILRTVALAGAVWLTGAALVRAGRRSTASVWLFCGVLLLAALILIPPVFHEHEPNPVRLLDIALAGFLLTQLLPCLALVMVAMLLHTGLNPRSATEPAGVRSEETQKTGRIAAISLALSGLVLAGGLYHFYWLFVWDSTYDALDVLFLLIPILTILLSATLLAELLVGRQKLAALVYVILIPALVILVFRSAKQVNYRDLTEARAERISQALASYRNSQGRYPETLAQLVPRTILSIPDPVILYGQKWCYQGTTDFYQLGFVDREHWSSPELFATVYKTLGPAEGSSDLCEAEIMVLKERYPDFYGFAHR